MKIIYIPGFLEGQAQLRVIRYALSKHNVICFGYDTRLKETIPNLANKLKHFVDNLKLKPNEKIAIIGYSAGSTIADYYLKFVDNKKVSKFISVCSPVEGTFLANICSKKRLGLLQLKPKSKFLADLARKKLLGISKEIWQS